MTAFVRTDVQRFAHAILRFQNKFLTSIGDHPNRCCFGHRVTGFVRTDLSAGSIW